MFASLKMRPKSDDSHRGDRILRFFLRLEILRFSPHSEAISLQIKEKTENLEKKQIKPLEILD